MKIKFFVFLLAVGMSSFCFSGCETKCENPGQAINIGKAHQYFTVKYLDNAGNNWFSNPALNLSNVWIERSTEGDNGPYLNYDLPTVQGRIGPEFYSVLVSFDDSTGLTDTIPIMKGPYYQYRYKLHIDTFRVDYLGVDFYPTVNECQEVWQTVKWMWNGDTLDSLTHNQIVDMVITTDSL